MLFRLNERLTGVLSFVSVILFHFTGFSRFFPLFQVLVHVHANENWFDKLINLLKKSGKDYGH